MDQSGTVHAVCSFDLPKPLFGERDLKSELQAYYWGLGYTRQSCIEEGQSINLWRRGETAFYATGQKKKRARVLMFVRLALLRSHARYLSNASTNKKQNKTYIYIYILFQRSTPIHIYIYTYICLGLQQARPCWCSFVNSSIPPHIYIYIYI